MLPSTRSKLKLNKLLNFRGLTYCLFVEYSLVFLKIIFDRFFGGEEYMVKPSKKKFYNRNRDEDMEPSKYSFLYCVDNLLGKNWNSIPNLIKRRNPREVGETLSIMPTFSVTKPLRDLWV